jgi:hypothetical protein
MIIAIALATGRPYRKRAGREDGVGGKATDCGEEVTGI